MDTWLSWDDPAVAEVEERGMSMNQAFVDWMNGMTIDAPILGNVVRGIVVVKDDITGVEVYNSRPHWNDELEQKALLTAEFNIRLEEDCADIVT